MKVLNNTDVHYLADNLTVEQLRREIHQAELRQCVADAWRRTEFEVYADWFPYGAYAVVCQEAIEHIRGRQPKPKPIKGKINVEELKARTGIVEMVERYTTLRKAGKNFTGCCPIHNERHPSLTVYPDEQRWWCYGACNAGGDAIDFIMAVEGTDFKGAVALLGAK